MHAVWECPFHNIPIWTLEIQSLKVVPSIKYLGTILSSDNGCSHMESRKKASIKAFYSLQGAGVKYNGVNPETAVNIYRTDVESVMSYGCSFIHMSQTYLKKLDSIQSMHLKSIMGLRKCARTTMPHGSDYYNEFVKIPQIHEKSYRTMEFSTKSL